MLYTICLPEQLKPPRLLQLASRRDLLGLAAREHADTLGHAKPGNSGIMQLLEGSLSCWHKLWHLEHTGWCWPNVTPKLWADSYRGIGPRKLKLDTREAASSQASADVDSQGVLDACQHKSARGDSSPAHLWLSLVSWHNYCISPSAIISQPTTPVHRANLRSRGSLQSVMLDSTNTRTDITGTGTSTDSSGTDHPGICEISTIT